MAYGFTYTCPTATEAGFVVVLKTADFPAAALDGTANALANGGGDLIAYTDSSKTTRLPVDIVNLVSGGSPAAEVHIRYPTAETAATIYIEADDVQVSQPAFGAQYGRYEAWQDAETALVMESTTPADRTGNHSFSVTGTPELIAGPYGTALRFAGTERLTNTDVSLRDILTTYNTTVTAVCQRSGYAATKAVLSWEGTDDLVLYPYDVTTGDSRVFWRDMGVLSLVASGSDKSGLWLGSTFTTRATNAHELYIDETLVSTSSNTGSAGPFSSFYIGGFGPSSQDFDGDVAQVVVWKTARTSAWVAVEDGNRTAVLAWGTVGAWADAGGGGITASLTSTLSDATVSATGTVTGAASITGSLAATLGDATLSSSAVVPVVGSLSSTLADATVSASGVVGTVPVLASLTATLDDATVSSTGVVPITGSAALTLASATLSSSSSVLVQGTATGALEELTVTATASLLTAPEIEGGSSLTINTNGGSLELYFNGSDYFKVA